MRLDMVLTGVGFGVFVSTWLRAVVVRLSVRAGEPDHTDCSGCGRMLLPHGQWWRSVLPPTGRCPGCRHRVGPPAGTIELAAGALAGAIAGTLGPEPELLAFGFLALLGVTLGAIDLAVHRLPDRLTLPAYPVLAALLTVAAVASGQPARLAGALAGGATAGLAYLALVLLRPSQLGLGDAKLAGLLGMALGWLSWDAVVLGNALAFVLSGLAGLALLIARRASLATAIPLGPFMLAGAAAVVLAGLPAG